MRQRLLAVILCLGLARTAAAQITIPNTLVSGATILASQLNANFSSLGTNALNRTGGTLTGTLTTRALTPSLDATYGIGDGSHRYTVGFFSGALTAASLVLSGTITGATSVTATSVTAASGAFSGAVTVGSISGNGAGLTTLTAANISAGTAGINITGTAPAGTLTGSTLASGVTASSLTSTGTVTSGTWSASFGAVSGANLTSLTGANVTGTVANATTAATTTGNAGTATTLQTARTINGTSFNGSANISLPTTGASDYEAATWSPYFETSNGDWSGTQSASGWYVKAGGLCIAAASLDQSGTPSGSGDVRVYGFPYAFVGSASAAGMFSGLGGPSARSSIVLRAWSGQTYADVDAVAAAGGTTVVALAPTNLSGFHLEFSIPYRC